MRLTTIIIITTLMQVSASSFSQSITLKRKDASLSQILNEVRRQSGYDFIFNKEILKDAKPVTIDVNNATIEEVLKRSLNGQSIEYRIEDKIVSLDKKEINLIDKIKEYFASITVIGKVVDENGRPIAGVSIRVKNGKSSTISTSDGSFSLSNVDEGSIIVFSYIGYNIKELKASKDLASVMMILADNKLDEVQVQAYGLTSRRLSTSNISTIKADIIEKQNVTNPLLAIQGRIPGVQITSANGLPNAGVTVRIQGENSFAGKLDPLYVIDGVPYVAQLLPTGLINQLGYSGGSTYPISGANSGNGNPMSFINSSDIESIDVLKDADATSIYGSRAGNGAILITTKRGKSGKNRVDVDVNSGWSEISRRVGLLNSEQYLEVRNEAFKNDNIIPNVDNAYDILNLYGWNIARTQDWQKILLGGKAGFTRANVAISGGSESTQYRLSGTYSSQGTITPSPFKDEKAALQINLNSMSSDKKFKVHFVGNFLRDENKLQDADIANMALTLAPTAPDLYNPDGTLNWGLNSSGNSTWSNPLASLSNFYKNSTNNLIGSIDLSYKILDNLSFGVIGGYNMLLSDETKLRLRSSEPPQSTFQGQSEFAKNKISSWNIDPTLNYKLNFGRSALDVLVGGTVNRKNANGISLVGTGFSSDALAEDLSSAAAVRSSGTIVTNYKHAAAFARLNYNYDNKYIINLTARRDGSSRFGTSNRYHNFGAVGVSWIFTSENWFKELPFISFGKLRASYGTTGNDQIPDYLFLDLQGTISSDRPYQGIPTLTSTGLFNGNLQWEVTKKLNMGIDLGLFKNRINLDFNYAINHSGNSLVAIPAPITAGGNISAFYTNLPADIRNSSFEFSLSSKNLIGPGLNWLMDLNFSKVQNKLVSFPGIENTYFSGMYIVGKPLNYTLDRSYHYLGIDPMTGGYMFSTVDGGVTNNPQYAIDNYEYKQLSTPLWNAGISNTLSYGGFDFSIFLSVNRQWARAFFANPIPGGNLGQNYPVSILERWSYPGDISPFPKYSTSPRSTLNFNQSDANVIDASNIKIQNLSLGYTFNTRQLKYVKVQSLKVYSQVNNLMTFSRYQGFDPETGVGIPPLRTLTFGIRMTL